MKPQEQIAENLHSLGCELNERTNSLERHLILSTSLWNLTARPDLVAELEKLNRFTEEIRKHSGFVWLESQSGFNKALQLFEGEIRKVQSSEFEIARMRIRLLHAISGSGWQLLDDSSWIPRKISKAEKARAIKIAEELLAFVQKSVGRPDYSVMQSLEEPLIQFVGHMQTATKREYSGPVDRQREIAIRFTLCLRDFGLRQSKVVELLESTFSIFEADLVHRTAQNYVIKGFAR